MSDPTVLATSRRSRLATAVLLPLGGALLGWAVLTWHDVWLALDWAPMRGPVALVDRFDTWLGAGDTPVLVGLGVLLGVALVLVARSEEVTVAVGWDRVRVTRDSGERTYRRADVREALVDGKHLVLVADNGTELLRVRTEFGREALADAFRAHGYEWTGS
ncbi:hypothetical protein ACFFTK_04010 [Pseudonocardia petroleophila]|uniref:YqeB PH domain-containing protein n=1 Tax=Pseudonocardia petroleophila TaxID=37331 RepID=A0A7G7MQ30_9PSEU|nr:hypothetical protein [Pseudonocardia petroleophila]QNG54891.1 hypothetical protein H6H00_14035 [Pseudonocardia petroleophila]